MSSKKTKKDIIDFVSQTVESLPKSDIEIACDTVFDEIASQLINGNRIEIRGFGSFSTRNRLVPNDPRKNNSNNNIERINCKSIYFRASSVIDEILNKKD